MCSNWESHGILGMTTEICFFPRYQGKCTTQLITTDRGKRREKKIEDAHALRAHLKIFHQASHQNRYSPPRLEHKPAV